MGSIEIVKYSSEYEVVWDKFVDDSRNGIFLFKRKFMDYHSDKFHDHSLLFFQESTLVGILPANIHNQIVYSHQGLTFGGLIYGIDTKAGTIGELVDRTIEYFQALKIEEIILKPVPYFLQKYPSNEDLYFWSLKGASIFRRDLSSLIDLRFEYKYSKGRKWIIAKGKKEGVVIKSSTDWISFFQILAKSLEVHGTKPVHSVDQLKLLHSRFPDQIRLYGAFLGEDFISGALTFSYGKTLHTQYLSNSETGRSVGGLDLLLDELIKIAKIEKFEFLSFGISTVKEGKEINSGLLQQKESYGGRGVLHDWYRLKLSTT